MPQYTYEEIEFRVPVRENFYTYRERVTPAYLVTNLGIPWASIVVHRKPGAPDDRWYISEFATGGAIDIPTSTSRDEAVSHAVLMLNNLGRKNYRKILQSMH